MKKRIFIILYALAIMCAFSFTAGGKVSAAAALDEIQSYIITVDPFSDGTLKMHYSFVWKVLSNEEGPLTWVKIGVANKQFGILNSSQNAGARKDGSYVRLDFLSSYHVGDIIEFDFTIKQSHLATDSGGYAYYEFKNGWFDDIYVRSFELRWKSSGIASITPVTELTDGYNVYKSPLNKGQSVLFKIQYQKGYMTLGENALLLKDYTWLWVIITIIAVILVFIIVFASKSASYKRNSGFYAGHYIFLHNNNTERKGGGFGGGGGGCACACACACAGGGRAGCSRKDFINSIDISAMREALTEKKEQP